MDVPSWINKKPEEMTADEYKSYQESMSRYVWNEGDYVVVHGKPE